MVAATVDGLRVVSLYAPNGRVVDSPFYAGKLAWFERLARWIGDELASGAGGTDGALVLGGDLNVAPTDEDVWDARAVHGGTHVSEPERAAFRALLAPGLIDAYRARHDEPGRFTWWDYRAGMFHKNNGMRIDHLLVSPPVAARVDRRRDRPGGAQGTAGPVRPRAAVDRPRRAGQAVRPRLGRRAQAHRVADPLTRRRRRRSAGLGDRVARDPADRRRPGVRTWRKPS